MFLDILLPIKSVGIRGAVTLSRFSYLRQFCSVCVVLLLILKLKLKVFIGKRLSGLIAGKIYGIPICGR